MIILMAARPFLLLSTAPIIAWTVNGGSTPTTDPITFVKGDAAARVADLIVRIMCAVPGLLIIAPYVIASFTAAIVNIIMWSASNVNRSKPVFKCQAQYTVVPNQRHQCGHAKCPVCQEWVPIQGHKCYIQPVVENEESEPTEEGGGGMVAPFLPCLFTRILKPCKMQKECLWLICCVIRRVQKRPFMC